MYTVLKFIEGFGWKTKNKRIAIVSLGGNKAVDQDIS